MMLLKIQPREVFNAVSANQEARLFTCYEKFAQERFSFRPTQQFQSYVAWVQLTAKSRGDKNPSFGSRILDFQVFDAFRDYRKRTMADILKKLGEDKEKSMALEDAFKSCRHPDSLSMSFLAADIGVTQEEIEVNSNIFLFFLSHSDKKESSNTLNTTVKLRMEKIALSKPKELRLNFKIGLFCNIQLNFPVIN